MSNTTEIPIYNDEDTQLINKNERASIAALDLQSTITIIIDNKQENKEEYELKEENNDELPPKGFLHRAHSLDSGKVSVSYFE